ncbi:hypothetical protein WA158_007419 [Blastocystis sp. Blastoise]
MSSKDTSVIKYKVGKNRFEIVITRGTHKDFKEGKLKINNICETNVIFSNAEKGTKASQEEIKASFPEMTEIQILEKIAHEGELQLSTEERREAIDMKKRQICEYISKTYVDPTNNGALPSTRVMNAINNIKGLQLDINKSAQDQAVDIVKKLSSVLNLKKNETSGILTISMMYYAKCLGIIKKWCRIRKERPSGDNFLLEIAFASTDMVEFFNQLTQLTGGDYQFANDEAVSTTSSTPSKPEKGGKKGKKGKK